MYMQLYTVECLHKRWWYYVN